MQNADFAKNIPINEKGVAKNEQVDTRILEAQQQQNTSIFGNSKPSKDVNQSNSNSSGMGGVGNIFMGGGMVSPAGFDNTSIFSGLNKGSNYAIFSKKDYNYDVPKLTEESIANQKAAEGPKRTNPKPYNIDMTPKANPYAAFKNAEMEETSFTEAIGNAFSSLFGMNKGV